MKNHRTTIFLSLIGSLILSIHSAAYGEDMLPLAAKPAAGPFDPWVPPAARKPSALPATTGVALQNQVEAKLKMAFDKADVARRGKLTQEEARRAGLGFVEQNFALIDQNRHGEVSFEDVKHYLKTKGAALK